MSDVKTRMFSRHHSLYQEIDALYGKHKPGLMGYKLFDVFYNTPNRTYHNFDHLDQMYNLHQNLMGVCDFNAQNMVDVELFIWWHDVVYDPRRKDNEYLSAQLFAACTPDSVHQVDIVCAILKSTHTGKSQEEAPWVQYCLDLDLSAMADTKLFKENGVKIRTEFNHLNSIEFNQGRRKFFEGMLTHKQIFYNPFNLDYFKEAEWIAHANIENEVAQLKQKGF